MDKTAPEESLEAGHRKQGVKEHDHDKDKPRKPEHFSRDEEDNRVHSLFPTGLPKEAKKDFLIYDWDQTKGRERNVRDPVHKPMALPIDDQILGAALPEKTASAAWEHLASDKPKPDIDNFIDSPAERKHLHARPDATETPASVLDPFDTQPPEPPLPPFYRWHPFANAQGAMKKPSEKADKTLPTENFPSKPRDATDSPKPTRTDQPIFLTSSSSSVASARNPVQQSTSPLGCTCGNCQWTTGNSPQILLATTPENKQSSFGKRGRCKQENNCQNSPVVEFAVTFEYKFQ